MNTLRLDPDPDNDLGKGIFAKDEEAKLLAQGYVFAHRHFVAGQKNPVAFCSMRPIEMAATELVLDAHRVLHKTAKPCSFPILTTTAPTT